MFGESIIFFKVTFGWVKESKEGFSLSGSSFVVISFNGDSDLINLNFKRSSSFIRFKGIK